MGINGRGDVILTDAERSLLEGRAFHAFFETMVPATGSAYFAFTTGDNPVLSVIQTFTTSSDVIDIEFFEGADIADGTSVTVFNKDRTSSDNSTILIKNNPTVNSEGTKIDKTKIGSTAIANTVITSIINGYLPWRLKANTSYLVKFTNTGNSDITVISRISIFE
ncbi:MAG: hypothetical protein DRO36_05030 [Candidatus Hecatellales archaeon]|nr:MAG: hypothetical protein DRO36_05030 [Candidatus Hecatellales archaeon]